MKYSIRGDADAKKPQVLSTALLSVASLRMTKQIVW
jgi:hypothetical protein